MSEGSPPEVEPPWKGLHPASLVVNLVPRALRLARAAWPLLLAIALGGSGAAGRAVDFSILLGFSLLAVSSTVVHFFTLRYRVSGGRLEIQSGLLNRQVRSIDPRRIQNVELVRNVFHRVSGLVEVRLETASGQEVEGLLSALSEEEGRALMRALEEAGPEEPAGDPDELGEVLVHNGLQDLFRFGATATRVGAGIALALGLLIEGTQLLEPEELVGSSSRLSRGTLGLFLVAALTGTWLLGIASALVRHHGFRLTRLGERLVATAGLLTTRRVELRLDKVQTVTVREPWLRRVAGFGSVVVRTAAVRQEAGGTVAAQALVPVVEAEDFDGLVRTALEGAPGDAWSGRLHPPDPRALYRRLLGTGIRGVVLGAILAGAFGASGLVFGLALLVFGLGAGWLDHRHQGWRLEGDTLIAREGYLDRRTVLAPVRKLQSVEVRQDPLRWRWGLGRLVVRVAGAVIALPDLDMDRAQALQEELMARSRRSWGE